MSIFLRSYVIISPSAPYFWNICSLLPCQSFLVNLSSSFPLHSVVSVNIFQLLLISNVSIEVFTEILSLLIHLYSKIRLSKALQNLTFFSFVSPTYDTYCALVTFTTSPSVSNFALTAHLILSSLLVRSLHNPHNLVLFQLHFFSHRRDNTQSCGFAPLPFRVLLTQYVYFSLLHHNIHQLSLFPIIERTFTFPTPITNFLIFVYALPTNLTAFLISGIVLQKHNFRLKPAGPRSQWRTLLPQTSPDPVCTFP